MHARVHPSCVRHVHYNMHMWMFMDMHRWVDRPLNVIGSGVMHGRYFDDMARLCVRRIFDAPPLAEQVEISRLLSPSPTISRILSPSPAISRLL